MSERGDEKPMGVARVDVDHRDHLRVAKAEVRPRPAGVGRLVHAVADREVGPNDAGSRTDVDDVRVGRRDSDGPNRSGRLVVEDWLPRRPVVGGAPDAAVVEADIEHVRLTWDPRERPRPAGASRTDLPPVHPERPIARLLAEDDIAGRRKEQGHTRSRHENSTHWHHHEMEAVCADSKPFGERNLVFRWLIVDMRTPLAEAARHEEQEHGRRTAPVVDATPMAVHDKRRADQQRDGQRPRNSARARRRGRATGGQRDAAAPARAIRAAEHAARRGNTGRSRSGRSARQILK